MKQSRFSLPGQVPGGSGSQPLSPVKKAVVLCLAALLIPYITTLAWTGSAEGSIQKPESTGKKVILDRGNGSAAMDLEEYLIGVTAVQIPPDYEQEALKAQAILARTAVRRQMDGADSVPESALDMDYLGQGQMEKLWGSEQYPEFYSRIREAVAETAGMVVTWNGDYIEPLFHRLSAGRTRQGGESAPYLVSVEAPEAVEGENFLSVFHFTREELSKKLNQMTESPEVTADTVLESIQIIEKETAGYVDSVMVGGRTYSGDAVRWALSLPSTAFHFEASESGARVSVRGIGHGYGLEQYGANEKAKAGWTAEEILNYYYQNIVILTE